MKKIKIWFGGRHAKKFGNRCSTRRFQRNNYQYGTHVLLDKNVAKKGSTEVVGSFFKFIQDVAHDRPELVLWSNFWVQNRNINMIAFFVSLVNDDRFSINKVTQRFLWSGHSYSSNDADFSHIEKKKDVIGVFSEDEYVHLIKNARKKGSKQLC